MYIFYINIKLEYYLKKYEYFNYSRNCPAHKAIVTIAVLFITNIHH